MKTAADYTKEIIDRAKTMRSFKVKLRIDDGWLPTGPVPFDIHIKDGIATLTIIANSMNSAQQLASVYMESDDWCE